MTNLSARSTHVSSIRLLELYVVSDLQFKFAHSPSMRFMDILFGFS
jgi:hypothetical protein